MTKPKLFGKEMSMSDDDGGRSSFCVQIGRLWVWVSEVDSGEEMPPTYFSIGVGPTTIFSGRLETIDLATRKAQELLRKIRDDLNELIGD